MDDAIEAMKDQLLGELNEWLGFDIPEEGSEDYETWKSREQEIEAIEDLSDIYYYLGGDDERAKDFFEQFGIIDFQSKI